MTVEERIEAAFRLRAEGANCAQAVVYALQDRLEPEIDAMALYKIMEGFGLGMGNMDNTCGALSGAIAAAGLVNSNGDPSKSTKAATYKLTKEMLRRFEEKNKAIMCKDLKGVETGTMLRSCPGCIEDAIRIACDVLEIKE